MEQQPSIDRFLTLSCLLYGQDQKGSRDEATRILAAHPSLAKQNIFAICSTGNFELLKQRLETEEIDVNEKGGPMNWAPLLYACYSRVEAPGGSTFEVAKLLLEQGADPNAHYMWGDQYKFTALTGAFGEGESGPLQQPPHRECEKLARLLLESGAAPNDSQALYNRMFTRGSLCMEILLEFGLGANDKNNWLHKEPDGTFRPDESGTLTYQMAWAIEKQHNDRVKLILDSLPPDVIASFVDQTLPEGNTLLKKATLSGNAPAREMLLAKGALTPELTPIEEFISAVAFGDTKEALKLLDANQAQEIQLRGHLPQMLIDAAGSDNWPVAKCTLDLGVDIDTMRGATALHQAAWSGHLSMVKKLLTAGADSTIKDASHDATPIDWANYSGNVHVAEYLNSLDHTE